MEENSGEVIDNSSVQTTIANTTPTPAPEAGAVDLASIIPEAYSDKPWVKDVKDIDGLFKLTDGLKSEIGKRPGGIPQETATDEVKKAFYSELGVPDSVEGYELAAPQEGAEEFQSQMKETMYKLNLTADQAKGLDAAYNELVAAMTPDAETLNADFDKLAEDTLGERRDEVLATAKHLLAENTKELPPEMQEHISNLPNKELIIMASVLDQVNQKYIREDAIPAGGNSAAASQGSARERGYALMQTDAWKDKSHPNHAETAAEVKRLYGT